MSVPVRDSKQLEAGTFLVYPVEVFRDEFVGPIGDEGTDNKIRCGIMYTTSLKY